MTGSNRRPSACKADALPAELILHLTAWQRPTLTGAKPQLPSALRSLTSVFGMGTGVAFSPLLPDFHQTLFYYNVFLLFFKKFFNFFIPSKLDNIEEIHKNE